MGINWRRALQGAALGVSDMAGQQITAQITERVAQKRDARMAQYRKAELTDERQYQDTVRRENYDIEKHQGQVASAAAAQAAAAERQNELTDAETRRQHELRLEREKQNNRLDLIEYEGQKNPASAPETDHFQVAFDKGDANQLLEAFDEVKKRASAAYELEDSLAIMEKLNKAYEMDKMEEFKAIMGDWVGTDASKAMQTFSVAQAPLVLAKLAQATGEQTDQDAARVERAVGSFGTSNEANAVAIDLMRKQIRRSINQYNEMADYKEKNGSLRGYRMPTDLRLMGGAEDSTSGASDNPVSVIQTGFSEWRKNKLKENQ